MENTQQANNLDHQPIQLSNTQDMNDDLGNTRKDSLEENRSMLNVMTNEENKYVLIINDQGQHLLTRESNIEKIQAVSNKEQKLEEYTRVDNENQRSNIWKSNIPDSSVSKKSLEISKKLCSKDEKSVIEDANDFFSMIMSPLESGLSSPTTEMEHLRVSSPMQKEDTLKPYNNFRTTIHTMDMNIINTNIEQTLNRTNNISNTLHTINEESLKQLLYSMEEK